MWTASHTRIGLQYSLFLIIGILIVYNVRIFHPIWFPIVLTVVGWYLYMLYYCSKYWLHLTDKQFERKLFWHSLLYRVITSLLLASVAYITWGIPDYVGAIDARAYHREARVVADYFRDFDFLGAYNTAVSFTGSVDNSGPPLLTGLIFAIFGKHYLVASFFYALIGSFSVLLLYRTATMIWGEEIGRTSGILFMPFPLALFFSVVILKEGTVVFLSLIIIYLVTKAIHGKRLSVLNIIALIISMTSLFLFRTPVGVLLVALLLPALVLNRYKGSRIKSLFIAIFSLLVFGYIMYIMGEYQFFIDRIYSAEGVGEGRTSVLGIEETELLEFSLRDLALSPVYLLLAVIAPFPGMVEVGTTFNTGHDQTYYYVAGEIVWNILAFFSVIGFYYSIKENLFNSFVVWAFTAGYVYMLIITVFVTRVRFNYILMVPMLALVAVGIYKTKNKKYWILYLAAVLIMTIIWNSLRLGVRGL